MELVGKYTIGGRVLMQDKRVVDGLYVLGKYGLPYINTNFDKLEKEDGIIVLDDLETAQNYIRYLSRIYRYEFRHRAKKLNVNPGEFRYYLIKLTDPMFANTKIGERFNKKLQKESSSKYKFLGRYNKVTWQSIERKE